MSKQSLFGDRAIVPVVMLHSVGAENLDWVFRHVSCPIAPFEDKVRVLRDAGFHFLFWSELYDYMAGQRSLDLPAILLTFDDGYLDNWVNVFPILQKYGVKATIFASADFIDPSEQLRPTVAGLTPAAASGLDIAGFLNLAEMRAMEASGLVDIQSHAKTHTWWFCNDTVVDFWRPGLRDYPWMAWNVRPDRKPHYLRENQDALVPFGTPIYGYGKALEVTRYIPAPEIAAALADYVEQSGGARFFERDDWQADLRSRHEALAGQYRLISRFETQQERSQRIRQELTESKRALEDGLGKHVDYICWPGGGYDISTFEMARAAGYKAWTLASSDQSDFRNVPGANRETIKRIGESIQQTWRGRTIGYTNGREFLCTVRRHQGSFFHKWMGRARRALRIVRFLLDGAVR